MTDPAPQPPVVDDSGNALVSFTAGSEDVLPGDAPLPLSLLALWHGERVLMVFDRYRQSWELPGGMIEPDESPRRAAVRELLEETGQEPEGPVRFVGYATFRLGPAGRVEHGALFTGRTANPRPFEPNAEISAAHWWDTREPLPGRIQPMDAHLARLTRLPASLSRLP